MASKIRLSGDLGFLRVGTALPRLRLADVDFNVKAIAAAALEAESRGVQVLVFPEMSLTGYTIGDLVQHQALLCRVRDGLQTLVSATASLPILLILGLPLVVDQKIFNCAAVLCAGRILGIVPKTLLSGYKEFYEDRWFTSGFDAASDSIELGGRVVPFGTDILFKLSGDAPAVIGVEVCEDLWVPLAPHESQALAGATILINLSASNDILGKAEWRRTMISAESGRCSAAYCYVSSGVGESSNDLIYGGNTIIAENGVILRESSGLSSPAQITVADIDLERLSHDRRVITSFRHMSAEVSPYRLVETAVGDPPAVNLERTLDPDPFVPKDPSQRTERCRDIFAMQVAALSQKLTGSGKSRIVLGISGGLDSTLALLAAVKTMDFLKLPRENVLAFTLPGFGTSRRTLGNALKLCQGLGIGCDRTSIVRTSRAHLADLGHDGRQDVAFENVQARYRTEFLFNKANQLDAIVLGTGDLTEVALGWSTFSGDQLSHYHINTSVPKTLVRYLVRWVADKELAGTPAQKVLYDILDTPISPELRRPENGVITQRSEDVIGPVELADFFLYPFIRFGTRPGKILFVANEVNKQGLYEVRYNLDDLAHWLRSFLVRFFANQFKRTCFPEGPKIGSVSLSPRGDWRMPSDASANIWLEDLEKMYARLREAE
jgi:NAD+ synthase (glutamine-hydrolysing)